MFEKQYKETFSQVVASDSLMQEVLNLKNKRNKKIRVTTLLAAVILMFALATTAFAYTSFVVYENPGQMLEALFGNSSNPSNEGKIYVDDVGQTHYEPSFEKEELNEQAAQEYVAPYIFEVGQSISYNGNTLTVDAASYDPYTQCGIVYLHLENPNGVPPYNTGLDGSFWHLDASTIRSNIIGTYFFVDEEKTTDTYLTLAGYFNKGDYMNEAVLKLHLEDDTQEIVIPLEATETMEHITLGNGGIQLSPIGLVIHGEKLNLLSGTETRVHYAKICYADGSEYLVLDGTSDIMVMNHAAAMKEPGDGYTTNRKCVTYLLNRVVPVKEVTAVIVDGVSYSVDSEPIDTPVVSGPEAGAVDEGIYTIDPTFTIHANNDPVIGQPLEFTEGLSSGKITYSITGAEYIRNIKDIPVDVYDYEVIPQDVMNDLDGEYLRMYSWLDMFMPDFIDQHGNFSDGYGMILVYATVETHDAVVDSTYHYTGSLDAFQALRLELFNTKDESVHAPNYFSEAWHEYQDYLGNVALMSVDAEDGKNYVVFGFYVGDFNYWINDPVDFSAFCVRGTEGDTKDILIPLDLKN